MLHLSFYGLSEGSQVIVSDAGGIASRYGFRYSIG